MRCIIIDDEPFAIELITFYVQQTPMLNLLGSFSDANHAIDFIQNHEIDLLFLDIQMPHINGIQLLKSLDKPPMVIFSTAFNEYAVEGFELEAIDYLLKPFDIKRFQKAVKKADELFSLKKAAEPQTEPFIFVKADYQMLKINISSILFIEGWDDYIKIYVSDKPILTLMSLKSIMEQLPHQEFVRVHRSYIVPIKKIESVRNKVIKIASKEIPVGSTYAESLYHLMNKK
jgi:DNA-binding LytR/AlgR family response regulator